MHRRFTVVTDSSSNKTTCIFNRMASWSDTPNSPDLASMCDHQCAIRFKSRDKSEQAKGKSHLDVHNSVLEKATDITAGNCNFGSFPNHAGIRNHKISLLPVQGASSSSQLVTQLLFGEMYTIHEKQRRMAANSDILISTQNH